MSGRVASANAAGLRVPCDGRGTGLVLDPPRLGTMRWLARAAREPAVVVSSLVVGAHLGLAALMPTRTSCLPVVPFSGVLVGAVLLVGEVVVWMTRRGASELLRTQGQGRVPGRLRLPGGHQL